MTNPVSPFAVQPLSVRRLAIGIGAAVVAALAWIAPVLAHEGMHGSAASYDINGDVYLSPAEFHKYFTAIEPLSKDEKARFKKPDENVDGKLSSAEVMRKGKEAEGLICSQQPL